MRIPSEFYAQIHHASYWIFITEKNYTFIAAIKFDKTYQENGIKAMDQG